MTRESKLYPSQIQAQCQSAVAILEMDNEKLELTSKSVAAFVNDTLIESVAFDQLKLQCENYIGIISSMREVNSSDIEDYNTLSGSVGSEVLIGAEILDNKEKYIRLREEAYAKEKIYISLAAQCWWMPSLASIYMKMAAYYHVKGLFYDDQYQDWLKKEEEYDKIETSTAGLFANSAATRAALGGMLSALQGAFKMDFGYIPESVIPAKLQLESVEMGDMDTANGIKALDEYLVQSGKFTAEERAAIINNAIKNNPELLKNIGSAIAVGVAEVNAKVVEETTETYIPKHIKMIENLQDADLGYSEEQMNALLSVGEELLLEGFDEKFVAGVLGNIVAEGAFGSFESSAYISNPEEEPEYLGIVDANCNYRESFSGKNIQEVGLDETVALYEKAQNIGGGFGLGCVQWTFSRTGDLLECYKEVCTSNYPTIEECYKAEVLLIKKELRGDYSYIYNNWEKENETSNIETCVREASNTVFCDYEKPGTDDMSERADNAWEIYQTMLGEE